MQLCVRDASPVCLTDLLTARRLLPTLAAIMHAPTLLSALQAEDGVAPAQRRAALAKPLLTALRQLLVSLLASASGLRCVWVVHGTCADVVHSFLYTHTHGVVTHHRTAMLQRTTTMPWRCWKPWNLLPLPRGAWSPYRPRPWQQA